MTNTQKPIKRRHNRPWKNTHIRVTKQSNTNQHTTLSRLQSVENTCWKTNSSTHVVIKKVDHTDRKDNLGKKKKGNIWRNQSRSTNEFLYMPGNHWTSKNKLLLSVKPTCVCGSDECVNLRVRVCGCGLVCLRCVVRVCVQQKTKKVALTQNEITDKKQTHTWTLLRTMKTFHQSKQCWPHASRTSPVPDSFPSAFPWRNWHSMTSSLCQAPASQRANLIAQWPLRPQPLHVDFLSWSPALTWVMLWTTRSQCSPCWCACSRRKHAVHKAWTHSAVSLETSSTRM